MNEFKRKRGRLLTASSLALAAILTTGVGTGWAQGNSTPTDGGTVTPGDSSPTTDITITGPTGPTASVQVDGAVDAASLRVADVNATEIAVTAATPGGKLTITGTGGNLVENTSTSTAIDLAIGLDTTVEVTGTGGTVGDIAGAGADNSTFIISGEQGAGLVVNAGDVSGVSFKFDPGTANIASITNSEGSIDDNFILNVAGNITVNDTKSYTITATKTSQINVGADVVTTGADSALTITADGTSTIGIANDVNVGVGSSLTLTSANTKAPITVGNDIINDGELSVSGLVDVNGNVNLGNDSETTVDFATTTITGNGSTSTATLGTGAELRIVNVKIGTGPTTILTGFDGGLIDKGGSVITSDTRLIDLAAGEVNIDAINGDIILDLTENSYVGARDAYADGGISLGAASMVDDLYLANKNDTESANDGIKFVSRAVNDMYLDSGQNNGRQVVTTLEGAASMAAVAGVQSSTYSIANTLAGNYNSRLSYLNDVAGSAGSGEPGTIGIWANPFYNSTDVDGVGIGNRNGEYEFNYAGGTIGLDSNITEKFRLGLAFSAGGGDTESNGADFNKTESDFDFWGLGVYSSYTNGRFGLTGDISYSGASYDVDQRLPSLMRMNNLTADVDTDTFTVGLTGEYRFITGSNLNIIPHLGLRYLNLKTDAYQVRERGRGNVFSIDSETQNIWTIPLGVTFTGDLNTSNGWVIQPKADLGVIFATGDLDADSRFNISGANLGSRLITANDVVDNVTFNGLIGLKAENCDGFSLGLDYNFKASDNLTSHGLTGTIRYDF